MPISVNGSKKAPPKRTLKKVSAKPPTTKRLVKKTATKTVAKKPAPRAQRNGNISDKDFASYTKRIKAAGIKRKESDEAHKEAVADLFDLVKEAIAAGMPVVRIEEVAGISRQWIYTRNRGN
jgi:hypothetical protein